MDILYEALFAPGAVLANIIVASIIALPSSTFMAILWLSAIRYALEVFPGVFK